MESSSTTGLPLEVCDGIDNDGNDVIDDLDAGNDGVCDCIRVASFGQSGIWRGGNVFSDWLGERTARGVDGLANQMITTDLLEPYHVVVIEDASVVERVYGQTEVDALHSWVESGGGLLTLTGYTSSAVENDNVHRLLAPWGLGYGDQTILPRQGDPVPVTEWVEHPLAASVATAGFDNGYPVVGPGLVYARAGGFDVGLAVEAGEGRIVVWGDEWIGYTSEWAGVPTYQMERFWQNTFKWLTPPSKCQVDIPSG